MIALAKVNNRFEERGACLVGLSVDSNSSHEVNTKLPKNNYKMKKLIYL